MEISENTRVAESENDQNERGNDHHPSRGPTAQREVDLQTCVCPIPLAKFQKRAYCSCPISSDMPLCTCLIIFGQPLAVPHRTYDLI